MRFVAVGIIILLLAGCFDSKPPEPVKRTRAPAYDVSQSFSLAYNATGCQEGIGAMLVEPAQAQKSLPPGFHAADAQQLAGTPTATGKAALLLNSVACDLSEFDPDGLQEGQMAVLVEEPSVPGERPAAGLSFYEVARVAQTEKSFELFQTVGWESYEGQARVVISTLPQGGATGSADVRDDQAILYTLGFTAPAPSTFSATARFWHETPGGIAFIDYTLSVPVGQGVGSCSVRANSVAANMTGLASCPPESTLAIVVPVQQWVGRFHYQAGVHAKV